MKKAVFAGAVALAMMGPLFISEKGMGPATASAQDVVVTEGKIARLRAHCASPVNSCSTGARSSQHYARRSASSVRARVWCKKCVIAWAAMQAVRWRSSAPCPPRVR